MIGILEYILCSFLSSCTNTPRIYPTPVTETYSIGKQLTIYPKEKHITVAVVDTGIRPGIPGQCSFGIDLTNTSLKDAHGHGTNIAGLIHKYAYDADYCQIPIKFKSGFDGNYGLRNEKIALRYAIDSNVDIINLSLGGSDPDPGEKALIEEALNKGILVVAAAGNDGHDLDIACDWFPACYDLRIYMVGSLNRFGYALPSSNFGKVVQYWQLGLSQLGNGIVMSGTSQATAIQTGKLVRRLWEQYKAKHSKPYHRRRR